MLYMMGPSSLSVPNLISISYRPRASGEVCCCAVRLNNVKHSFMSLVPGAAWRAAL